MVWPLALWSFLSDINCTVFDPNFSPCPRSFSVTLRGTQVTQQEMLVYPSLGISFPNTFLLKNKLGNDRRVAFAIKEVANRRQNKCHRLEWDKREVFTLISFGWSAAVAFVLILDCIHLLLWHDERGRKRPRFMAVRYDSAGDRCSLLSSVRPSARPSVS